MYIDYKSVLFFLGIFLTFGIIYFSLVGGKLREWGEIRQTHSMYRYKHLLQALAGIKDIILINKFKFFLEKYNNENIKVSKTNRNYGIVQQIPRIIMEFLFFLIAPLIAFSLSYIIS